MIIAVDFDGILCENEFPKIGKPKYEMISLVRQLIDAGHEVILWTSRCDDRLSNAVQWCDNYGLHFCAVNDNAPSNIEKYKTNPRKIFANVYIDDHNVEFIMAGNLGQAYLDGYLRKGVKQWKTEEN